MATAFGVSKAASSLVVVFLLVILACARRGDGLSPELERQKLVDEAKKITSDLADRATQLHLGRKLKGKEDCNCSVHSCTNSFEGASEPQCTGVLGKKDDACSRCSSKGKRLGLDYAMVRTPHNIDPGNLSDAIKESLCIFQPMDELFIENGKKFNSSTWSYIGTTSGVTRIWPSLPQRRGLEDSDTSDVHLGNCEQYDPRLRPWFNYAISGAKDVVILLDASKSMLKILKYKGRSATRWQIVKEAVAKLLDTFGINDHISIVTFHTKASSFNKEGFLDKAFPENIAKLVSELDNVEPKFGTNFRAGFGEAFDVLIKSQDEGSPSAHCEKVIIFLTDGKDCSIDPENSCDHDGEDHPEDDEKYGQDLVLDFIEEKQKELEEVSNRRTGRNRATIFAFTMTGAADNQIPKLISCANGGSWDYILENEDPVDKFVGFARFLAWGRQGADVVFTNMYNDSDGLGNLTTAAKPVFAQSVDGNDNSIPGMLIGVVGHDVTASQLGLNGSEFEKFVEVIQKDLEASGSFCTLSNASDCQIQVLRGREGECPERFDQAECYFYAESRQYFVSPDEKLNFKKARERCDYMNGDLAIADDKDKQGFLAGIAERSGSWIGLRQVKEDSEKFWRWLTQPHDGIGNHVNTSGLLASGSHDGDCGAIDPRGTTSNVQPHSCEDERRFICEFDVNKKPPDCVTDLVLKVDENYKYKLKPIRECAAAEAVIAASLEVSPVIGSINSKDLICDIGEPTSTDDVRCCCEGL